MIGAGLVEAILAEAWRRASELHGEAHWSCVAATGLALADGAPGSDRGLVLLFGLLHDTRRENEHLDPGHGSRAASYARAGTLPPVGCRRASRRAADVGGAPPPDVGGPRTAGILPR